MKVWQCVYPCEKLLFAEVDVLAGTDWSVIWYLGVEVTCCGDCAYLQF